MGIMLFLFSVNLFSKILICFNAILLLFVSSGLTFSHIECKKGERWVLGSSMPDCEKEEVGMICPFSGEVCSKFVEEPKGDTEKRSKKTYKIECNFFATSEDNCSTSASDFFSGSYFIRSTFPKPIQFCFHSRENLTYNFPNVNSPPLLSKPDLIEIQVFRI